MPLQPCRECGNPTSDTAERCPQCGAEGPTDGPITQTFKFLVWGFVSVVIIWVLALALFDFLFKH